MSWYHLTKVKAGGFAFGEKFTSVQASGMDDNAALAPDTFPVDVTFEQDVLVEGTFETEGTATFADVIVSSSLQSPVATILDLLVDVQLTTSDDVHFEDNGSSIFECDPHAAFNKTVQFNETVTFGVGGTGYSFEALGKAQFDDLVDLLDGLTVAGKAFLPYIQRKPLVVLTGDASYSISAGTEFAVYAGTADLEVTFLDTDSEDGESVEFSSSQVSETMILNMPAGTFPTPSWTLKNASAAYTWLKFTRKAGLWYRTGYSKGS